jgi:hypothetical protein
MIMTSGNTTQDTHIDGRIRNGLRHGPVERELRSNVEHAEKHRESASDLCGALLERADLHSNRARYRQLERAIARLVQASMDHARALAELGDFLVDGTTHQRRP